MNRLQNFFSKFKGRGDAVSEPQAAFEFALMDDATRQRIVDLVKPNPQDQNTFINLNVAFGVRDVNRRLFLTQTRFDQYGFNSQETGRIEKNTYAAVSGTDAFLVFRHSDGVNIRYEMPAEWEPLVIPAIELLSDMSQWDVFEKKMQQEDPDFRMLKIRNIRRNEVMEAVQRQFERENPGVTSDCMKEQYVICSKADAHRFFLENHCNPYRYEKMYTEETVRQFKAFADSEDTKGWAKEEYRRILCEIAAGRVEDFEARMGHAKFLLFYWIGDMPREDLLIKACQTIFEKAEVTPRALGSITAFLELFFNRFTSRAERIEPLLDLIDDYLITRLKPVPEAPMVCGNSIDRYRKDAVRLRRVISEQKEPENRDGHRMIVAPEDILEHLVQALEAHYSVQWEFKSEVLENLNFTYGVSSPDGRLYLTGLTYAANTITHHTSFDLIRFAAVVGPERHVLLLDCRRDTTAWVFSIQPIGTGNPPAPAAVEVYREALTRMIAVYRSQPERSRFFKALKDGDFGDEVGASGLKHRLDEQYRAVSSGDEDLEECDQLLCNRTKAEGTVRDQ